ncbi:MULTISPECIES: helix-turn-helix transcriptional regulator [unclassified Enterococcus]|uniref:helix-turn-helix domain-containing protein n=1 Tax=unclassified Enterococcus TaxID=2608891 RepID=UPI0013ED5878|nr:MULTISPECIES: helix-turn-helix transcriptional regulator [unclassified Enterococcus]
MSLGQRLKFIRERENYSQREIAEKLGISRQSISKWENDRGFPDYDNLLKLSSLLNVSIAELLENETLPRTKKLISEVCDKERTMTIEVSNGKKILIEDCQILLFLSVLSCVVFPTGFIVVPYVLHEIERIDRYYGLTVLICVGSLLVNLYYAYFHVTFFLDLILL